MTDSEKLDLILTKMNSFEQRFDNLERRFDTLENKVDSIDQRLTRLELHIENSTDRNIQLVAENFVNLTNKLNDAIPVADKNLAYEVKVNYLISEVDKLKREVNDLKSKTA